MSYFIKKHWSLIGKKGTNGKTGENGDVGAGLRARPFKFLSLKAKMRIANRICLCKCFII